MAGAVGSPTAQSGAGPGFTVGAWVGVGLGITAVAVGGASVGWASSGSQATAAAINASIASYGNGSNAPTPGTFAKVCIALEGLLVFMIVVSGLESAHTIWIGCRISIGLRRYAANGGIYHCNGQGVCADCIHVEALHRNEVLAGVGRSPRDLVRQVSPWSSSPVPTVTSCSYVTSGACMSTALP